MQTVILWWIGMSCIAAFNVVLLIAAYRYYRKRRPDMEPLLARLRNWQLYLATIYVAGCGFRSILPRGDIRRIVLVDHWISAVAIGRSVATIAELAFILQLSLMLYEGAKFSGNKRAQTLAMIPFPLIVIAEMFSWYACTTTNYMGTVIEESLWAVAATIILTGMLMIRPRYVKKQRTFITGASAALVAYIIYMVTVDVPTYFQNWQEAQASGKTYSTLREGFREVATQWTYTRAHADWQYEFIWMTLYFSLAVWVSIYMINAPHLNKNLKPPG